MSDTLRAAMFISGAILIAGGAIAANDLTLALVIAGVVLFVEGFFCLIAKSFRTIAYLWHCLLIETQKSHPSRDRSHRDA